MYQKGLEQGNPDVAAAIGVILVIFVLVLALVERKLVGDEDS
jgi:multiple sugar transport system permease protein